MADFALADALHFRRVQGIDLGSALGQIGGHRFLRSVDNLGSPDREVRAATRFTSTFTLATKLIYF
jgi:hypothetical protein